jgi:hypothetical protein
VFATAGVQEASSLHDCAISFGILVFLLPFVLCLVVFLYFHFFSETPNTDLRNLISYVSILLLSSALNIHVSLPYCRAGFEMYSVSRTGILNARTADVF